MNVRGAILVSLALLVLRLYTAQDIGWGDAEALYASYALHPQPGYVDHPGLIGWIARVLGAGGAPEPEITHVVTSVLATLVPWVGAGAARAAGATPAGAIRVVFALAFVPEVAVGLFALTPDLPLACTWLGALGLMARALRSEPSSWRALTSTLGAGALAGLACLAKASGGLLLVALLITLLGSDTRARWRTVAPWAAFGVAAVLLAPLVAWEIREGFPMLTHRFVATQGEAGLSARNAGALVGGQLLYVSPLYVVAAVLVGRDLFRRRKEESVDRLLWYATIIPAVVLGALCLWSRVAEPHWIAPAYLALAVHFGRPKPEAAAPIGSRLARWTVAVGAAFTMLVFVYVKTPAALWLLGDRYPARFDLANDLYSWKPAKTALVEAIAEAELETGAKPVVVGPHWIVCAQAHAALGGAVPVGCRTPQGDDFDRWLPREHWHSAPVILFVDDSRFDSKPDVELPNRRVRGVRRVEVRRAGRVVRTIRVTRLDLDRATARALTRQQTAAL